MSRISFAAAAMLLMTTTIAIAAEPIALRDMGSFHVGGRAASFGQAGEGSRVHARRRAGEGRPQRHVPGRADVRAVLPAANDAARSAVDVARRRAHRRHLRDDARRPRRLAELFIKQAGTSTIPTLSSAAAPAGRMYPDIFKGEPVFLTKDNPFERFRIGQGAGSYNADPAKRS